MQGDISNGINVLGNLGDGTSAPSNGVIRALNGRIGRVEVAGIIRGPGTSAVRVQANQGIGLVKAASIFGPISANASFCTGKIGRLETTNGPLSGTVACIAVEGTGLERGVSINGDLTSEFGIRSGGLREHFFVSGNITSTGKIDITQGGTILDDATHNGRITVGGSVAGEIRVDGAAGLKGQIITNANNTSGTWTGPVRIGPTGNQIVLDDGASQPYQAPYYAVLSSTLGGGAVGLVPYGLHKEDCEPSHAPDGGPNLYWASKAWPQSFGGQTRETFVIKHYGPVFAASSGPYLIERRKFAIAMCGSEPCAGQDLVWVDRTTMFDVYAPRSGSREVWVAMKNNIQGNPVEVDKNHAYRFSLVADSGVTRLQSDQTLVTTTPKPTVVGYPYEVKPLFFDLNQNLVADLGDVEMWMEEPADVDYSGQIDTEDLIRLIEVVGM